MPISRAYTSPRYSTNPAGHVSSCDAARGLLVLREGSALFTPKQDQNWIAQYCAGFKTFNSGITVAMMFAGATIQQLKHLYSLEAFVFSQLARHFGRVRLIHPYSPSDEKYATDDLVLDAKNRNELLLLTTDFVDGMLHDRRFPAIENDQCLNVAWGEASHTFVGVRIGLTGIKGFYAVEDRATGKRSTMFTAVINPMADPKVQTIV